MASITSSLTQVIAFAMFIAAVVRKPDEQVMNSVNDKDVEDAEKKFMNLCADNIGTYKKLIHGSNFTYARIRESN